MYCLNLKYQIKKMNDLFIIQNCINSEAILAFKAKAINYNKFKKFMYYGIEKEWTSNLDTEEKLAIQLLNKNSELFKNYPSNESRKILNLVRDYTVFFIPYFISTEAIEEYLVFAENIIDKRKKFNVHLYLNGQFPHVEKFVSEIPFVNIIEQDKIQKGDMLIGTQDQISNIDILEDLSDYILALNCRDRSIEIGPLVNIRKFEIPEYMNIVSDENNYSIMNHEELLICFFLERILFIQLFKLYNKMRQNEFFPTRNKVCINRMDLQGYSEAVTLYPKYLSKLSV